MFTVAFVVEIIIIIIYIFVASILRVFKTCVVVSVIQTGLDLKVPG